MKSSAKTYDEILLDSYDDFRKARGGAVRMEDVARWMLDNNLVDAPTIPPVKLLTKKLKQAARRARHKDPQGRTVRTVVAAKIEKITAGGQKMIDVVWDYLNEMSLDHALTAFEQRDQDIEKQRLSATREVHSFVDNNPNARGHESRFEFFAFMLEEPVTQVAEEIGESPTPNKNDGEYDEGNQLTSEKPR